MTQALLNQSTPNQSRLIRESSNQSLTLVRQKIGAGERNRTLDLLITSELLYQLSYTGFSFCRAL
jgi:hypothetical protein